jgi:hypothetical protein
MFSPFSSKTSSSDTLNGTASSMARQTSINRGHSFKLRLKRFWKTLMRPFVLPVRPLPSSAYPMTALPRSGFNGLNSDVIPAHARDGSMTTRTADPMQRIHSNIYWHPDPTYRSMALRAENQNSQSDPISLPFRLSFDQFHDKTHRNVPYLRQSWTRIDFVAVVSFWITFGLAMAGIERGVYHIGIFRAMSVIRTARLLTITSGKTVCDLPHHTF